MPAWTLSLKRGRIVRSHIDWRGEQVSARTISTSGGKRGSFSFLAHFPLSSAVCIYKQS